MYIPKKLNNLQSEASFDLKLFFPKGGHEFTLENLSSTKDNTSIEVEVVVGAEGWLFAQDLNKVNPRIGAEFKTNGEFMKAIEALKTHDFSCEV